MAKKTKRVTRSSKNRQKLPKITNVSQDYIKALLVNGEWEEIEAAMADDGSYAPKPSIAVNSHGRISTPFGEMTGMFPNHAFIRTRNPKILVSTSHIVKYYSERL